MPGKLRGPCVIITNEKEANRVYNKGYPGRPISGGGLMLSVVEGAFLMDERGFGIDGINGLAALFDYARRYIHEFEVNYLVYRELKLRGFIVRVPDSLFELDARDKHSEKIAYHILPRGATSPGVAAFSRVIPISERETFSVREIASYCRESNRKGLETLVGVVDEDGDVTFYGADILKPAGDCEYVEGIRICGVLVHNRVVTELNEKAKLLHKEYFFGRPLGSLLHLSLLEAGYLMERGIISIKALEWREFVARAKRIQRDFTIRYQVYSLLRERGLRVKTGFKYGTHFRVYSSDPELTHADFLVHITRDKGDWQEISRGIRVANGVKKRILFPISDSSDSAGEFLELGWVKP